MAFPGVFIIIVLVLITYWMIRLPLSFLLGVTLNECMGEQVTVFCQVLCFAASARRSGLAWPCLRRRSTSSSFIQPQGRPWARPCSASVSSVWMADGSALWGLCALDWALSVGHSFWPGPVLGWDRRSPPGMARQNGGYLCGLFLGSRTKRVLPGPAAPHAAKASEGRQLTHRLSLSRKNYDLVMIAFPEYDRLEKVLDQVQDSLRRDRCSSTLRWSSKAPAATSV